MSWREMVTNEGGISYRTVQQTAGMQDTKLAFQSTAKIQSRVRRRLTQTILMNALFNKQLVNSTCQKGMDDMRMIRVGFRT